MGYAQAWVIIQTWVIIVSTPLGRESTGTYLQVLDNTIQVEYRVIGSIATNQHASNKHIYFKESSLARDDSVRIGRSRKSTLYMYYTTVFLSVCPQSSKSAMHIEWAELQVCNAH